MLMPSPRSLLSLITLLILPSTALRADEFATIVQPFMQKYCVECHNAEEQKGGLGFHTFQTEEDFRAMPDIVDVTQWVIEEGEMPPRTAKVHPTEAEQEAVVAWMQELLNSIRNAAPNDPGLVTMPRLNHREYERVVRSLTGQDIRVASLLPVDGAAGEGFLNVGQAHQMQVEQFEAFLGAAKALVQYAIPSPDLGLVWMPTPHPSNSNYDLLLAEFRQMHAEALDRLLEPIYDRHMQFVRRNGGLAIFFEACWRYKHREALGFGRDATFADIAASFEQPLLASSIERLWYIVDWKNTPAMPNPPWTPAGGSVGSDYHYHALDRGAGPKEFVAQNHLLRMFIDQWQALPAPEGKADLAKGTELNRKLWNQFHKTIRGERGKNKPEIQSDRRVSPEVREQDFGGAFAGNKNYRIDLSKVKGDYIYLSVGDCWDGNEGDFVMWTEGRVVRFGKGESSPVPWQEVFTEVTDHQNGNQPVSFGSHPLEESVEPHTIAVQAPSVLRMRVPDDLRDAELHLQMKLDPKHGMNSSTQSVIDHKIPENLHWLPGRRILGKLKSERGARAEGSANLIGNWLDYRYKAIGAISDDERRVLLAHVKDAAQFGALNEPQARGLGIPWPLRYDLAFYPTWIQAFNFPTDYLPLMTAEERAEYDRINQLLISLGSQTAAELRGALLAAGITEPARGLFPSVEQFQQLPPQQQTHIQQLAQAYLAELETDRPAAEKQIAEFMRVAWRGQVTPDDVANIMEFYDRDRQQGKHFVVAVRDALLPVLIHPRFLFRFNPATREEIVALTPHALASRLSFMLWGTVPDDRLLELAASGELSKPEVLQAEVERMLQDEKSEALASEFTGLWLQFADFDTAVNPDPKRFPAFTPQVKEAMAQEPIEFFHYLFQENQPITDAILGDYTFLNEPLAKLYGVPGVKGPEMRKVSITDGRRGGIIGMGNFLTKFSTPLRTSPVIRGHWLYEKVLGIHMPPPPPNVEPLSDDDRDEQGRSVREQLEQHRSNPACFSCHDRFDPLGIAMENFDPIGAWREKDTTGAKIDADGLFVSTGRTLNGVAGLREYLAENKDLFVKTFCKKLLSYAIGRPVEVTDQPLLDEMLAAMKAEEYRPAAALRILVASPQFLNQRDQDPTAPTTAAAY